MTKVQSSVAAWRPLAALTILVGALAVVLSLRMDRAEAWVLEHLYRPDDPPRFAFSHHNIYPTLVSLFSREPEVSNGDFRSLLSATVRQPPLRYVYGVLWSSVEAPQIFEVNAERLHAFGNPR